MISWDIFVVEKRGVVMMKLNQTSKEREKAKNKINYNILIKIIMLFITFKQHEYMIRLICHVIDYNI